MTLSEKLSRIGFGNWGSHFGRPITIEIIHFIREKYPEIGNTDFDYFLILTNQKSQ